MFHLVIEILEVLTGLLALIYISNNYKKLAVMVKKDYAYKNDTKGPH